MVPHTAQADFKGATGVQVLLPVMIYTAGPISGAHFNPMVTSVFVMARMQVVSRAAKFSTMLQSVERAHACMHLFVFQSVAKLPSRTVSVPVAL